MSKARKFRKPRPVPFLSDPVVPSAKTITIPFMPSTVASIVSMPKKDELLKSFAEKERVVIKFRRGRMPVELTTLIVDLDVQASAVVAQTMCKRKIRWNYDSESGIIF